MGLKNRFISASSSRPFALASPDLSTPKHKYMGQFIPFYISYKYWNCAPSKLRM